MNISIVVPAYNEERYIGPLLESIAANRTSDILEVIVINNASTDSTATVAAAFPGVRLVDEPNKGLTKARQRGLIEAKGDYVAYLDADTRVPPGWVERAKEAFTQDPKMVCLSGPFHYYDLSGAKKNICRNPMGYHGAGYVLDHGVLWCLVRTSSPSGRRSWRSEALIPPSIFTAKTRILPGRLSKVGKAKFKMGFYILGLRKAYYR